VRAAVRSIRLKSEVVTHNILISRVDVWNNDLKFFSQAVQHSTVVPYVRQCGKV